MSYAPLAGLGPAANATPPSAEEKWFYCTSTITMGDWVIPDTASPFSATSAYGPCGVKTSAATANLQAVGVCVIDGGTAGTTTVAGTTSAPLPVKVVVRGYVASAKVNAGVAAQEGLSLEAAAGSATTASASTFPYVGRALANASGGFAPAYVNC